MAQQNELSAGLVVAHVDHGVHPQSREAATHVSSRADQLKLPCLSARLENVGTSEEALRNARYEALIQMAKQVGAAAVLTAVASQRQIRVYFHQYTCFERADGILHRRSCVERQRQCARGRDQR